MNNPNYKLTDEKFNIELSFAQLAEVAGILALYWAEGDCQEDNVKALFDVFNKRRKEIINKNLN